MGVCNGASHLRGTLDSVLSQEGARLELVVVDDGSTDDTPSLLEACARRDGRVRVLRQENLGLTRALIRGCAEARGRYIARQDAGDLSLPGRLAAQKAALDAAGGTAFVSCWTEFCGPEGEPLYVAKGTGRAASPLAVLDEREPSGVIDGPAAHPSVMFAAEAYRRAGGYRAEFRLGQDWDLWYRLAAVGSFQMVERVLYESRLLAGGISLVQKGRQEALARLSREALGRRLRGLPEDDLLAAAALVGPAARPPNARERARGPYFIGECLRRRGNPKAQRYFRQALRLDPLMAKAWVRLLQASLPQGRKAGP
jgi:glycosyltransferase involved in cell wall biosynthesis